MVYSKIKEEGSYEVYALEDLKKNNLDITLVKPYSIGFVTDASKEEFTKRMLFAESIDTVEMELLKLMEDEKDKIIETEEKGKTIYVAYQSTISSWLLCEKRLRATILLERMIVSKSIKRCLDVQNDGNNAKNYKDGPREAEIMYRNTFVYACIDVLYRENNRRNGCYKAFFSDENYVGDFLDTYITCFVKYREPDGWYIKKGDWNDEGNIFVGEYKKRLLGGSLYEEEEKKPFSTDWHDWLKEGINFIHYDEENRRVISCDNGKVEIEYLK